MTQQWNYLSDIQLHWNTIDEALPVIAKKSSKYFNYQKTDKKTINDASKIPTFQLQ